MVITSFISERRGKPSVREVVHLLVIALVNDRWPKNLRAELTVLLLLEVVEPSNKAPVCPPAKEIQKI